MLGVTTDPRQLPFADHPGARLERDDPARRAQPFGGEPVAGTHIKHTAAREDFVERANDMAVAVHRRALDGEHRGIVGPVERDDGHRFTSVRGG
jgi:hypothetical protein